MEENQRNFLLAIVLSIAILLVWQVWFGMPKMSQDQHKAQQQAHNGQQTGETANTKAPGANVPRPAGGSAAPQSSASQTAPNSATPQASPKGLDRDAALARSPRVAIDTPSLAGSIALKGARLDDLTLKKYQVDVDPQSANVTLFSPSGAPHPYYAEHGWVASGDADVKVPDADTVWTASGDGPLTPKHPVTLTWDNGAGLAFARTISVDDKYMFTVTQSVKNTGDKPVKLFPYALISRHGIPKVSGYYILHEGLLGVLGEDGLQEIDYKDALEDGAKSFKAKKGWLGITDKYWAAVVIPKPGSSYQGRFSGTDAKTGKPVFQADYLGDAVTVPAGGSANAKGFMFAGAKVTQLVDSYEKGYGIDRLDLLIDWGWFYFLTKPLFFVIDFFYHLVGNFGLSILIVTVLIKLCLFPLANKSYVSMSKMKKLQPEMEKIKKRFADDKTRQQQAMMELYKTEKVNPASGCLPIVVQIPVFFALYKVLFVTIEMRHAPFFGWIHDLSAPDPTSVFNLFGLIPWDPPHALMIGVWPLIMGCTMFMQMRLNPSPPDPIQQKIFTWMPVVFTFMLARFPAGLVIYWAWNNTLSVIQQSVIMSRQGIEIHLWKNLGLKKRADASGKP